MRKAAFIDRDGTINVDNGYIYRKEDFNYLDGAIDGLLHLQSLGYCLVIITNQSGIARGYYTEKQYFFLTEWLIEDLKKKGIYILNSYYCPHLPCAPIAKYAVNCDCRKPKLGLFYKAQKDLNLNLDQSIAIGDKIRDLSICRNTTCRGFLIGKEKEVFLPNVVCCTNWKQVISYIKE